MTGPGMFHVKREVETADGPPAGDLDLAFGAA